MQNRSVLLLAAFMLTAASLTASVIGANTPALPLTAERIAALPHDQRAKWNDYLSRSLRQKEADRAFLAAELKKAGLAGPLIPPKGQSARSVPLDRPAHWYGGAEARRIADIVVSFQTPAGGWSKNLNLADHVRKPGEDFATDNRSRFLGKDDFDAPEDPSWSYVGTLDNDATHTELKFLAKIIAALSPKECVTYRASFLKGLDYLFAAQFPNGGWPQVWPLDGGYHDAITFNDDAVTGALEVLEGVAEGNIPFVPVGIRARARASVTLGIECILATQILENGQRTVWAQQHDPLTLKPVAGRNFEPPAQCSNESAGVVLFLMSLPHPSPAVAEAVRAAVAWFKKTALYDVAWQRGPQGARLVPAKGEGPIWSRYNEIGTDRPIFADRDKSIHDRVEELSPERQRGYGWYNDEPQKALDRYTQWSRVHPAR
jgi:PelA/Pel-15E family pectate lyase